ncbi:Flp pilus assembly protein CpaB [Alsobacter sp. SYSU M60028]|uniref:Flp pilus assembly protein CpaB n=1 Tax=Alsobacter ponti TaxID=2962936 RepID=A0ABT1L8W1_9HYPH|nr:Flp pilus assembly protein CpaB [Alsobacter ponti]
MLVAALVLGGAAAFLARGLLLQRAAQQVERPMATIVIAAQPLAFGIPLTADNVSEVSWAADALPEGAFRTRDELLREGRRVVLSPIQKNEPILASKITGAGQRASLSALIDPGMRAVTVRVDEVRGVAGFVLPGDRVDMVLTRNEQGGTYADVLLQNVKVLAVDQLASERQETPTVARAVTVEVNTQQAQKLILASGVGTLSLVLRQAGGTDPELTKRVTVADLGDGEYVDKSRQEAAERMAGLEARIDELKKISEQAETSSRNDALTRIKELESRMQAELRRLSDGKTAVNIPPPAEAAPPLQDTTIIRVMRGLRREEISVPKDVRR